MIHLTIKFASHGIFATFILTEFWHKVITQDEDDDLSYAQKLGLDIQAALILDYVMGGGVIEVGNMMDFFLSLSNMETHLKLLADKLKVLAVIN